MRNTQTKRPLNKRKVATIALLSFLLFVGATWGINYWSGTHHVGQNFGNGATGSALTNIQLPDTINFFPNSTTFAYALNITTQVTNMKVNWNYSAESTLLNSCYTQLALDVVLRGNGTVLTWNLLTTNPSTPSVTLASVGTYQIDYVFYWTANATVSSVSFNINVAVGL